MAKATPPRKVKVIHRPNRQQQDELYRRFCSNLVGILKAPPPKEKPQSRLALTLGIFLRDADHVTKWRFV
jgi:hypothetical protein